MKQTPPQKNQPKETAITLKFKGKEAELLNELVAQGFFSSKSEAIRAALVQYFLQLGLLNRQQQWDTLKKTYQKRNINPEKLQKELEKLEDAI